MRKLQPNAVISISGPDIRWCGNEAGQVRPSEWSVVAADMTDPAITAQLSQQEDNEEFRNRPLDETQADLGSRECLRNEEKLSILCPYTCALPISAFGWSLRITSYYLCQS